MPISPEEQLFTLWCRIMETKTTVLCIICVIMCVIKFVEFVRSTEKEVNYTYAVAFIMRLSLLQRAGS